MDFRYSLAIEETSLAGGVNGPPESKSCLQPVEEMVVDKVEGLTHSPRATHTPHTRLLPPAAIPRV